MANESSIRYRDRHNAWPAAVIIALVSCAGYFLFRDHFVTGDPLIYADNILRMRFDDISIHFGYYLLGYCGHLILAPVGLAIDQILIILSNVLGAVGLVFAFLLVRELTGHRLLAHLSVVFLGASGIYLFYATSAEVYVPQTAVLLISMYCFITRRAIIAGLALALALLISPLTLSVVPFYLYVWYWRRIPIKTVLVTAGAFALGFLSVFLPLYEDWLWGRRGLLAIGLNTPLLSISDAASTVVALTIKSFHWATLFIPVGLVSLFSRRKALFSLVLIMLICQVYIVAKVSDATILGAFLLQVYVFIALLIAEGLIRIANLVRNIPGLHRGVVIAVLALFVTSSLVLLVGPSGILQPRITWNRTWPESIQNLSDHIAGDSMVITNFRYGVAYSFYSREEITEELETTVGNQRWINHEYLTPLRMQELLDQYDRFLVIETYSPSPGPVLFLTEEQLQTRFNQHSTRAKMMALLPGAQMTDFLVTDELTVYELLPPTKTPAGAGDFSGS